MHVLILNQTFHPDVASTGQLMWDLARHLRDAGHRVTVVTSRNFYGTNRRHDRAIDDYGGIVVHRVGGTALGKRSTLARLLDFASFYAAAGVKLYREPAPDVTLALTSPPKVATLAMLQRWFRRTPADRPVRFVYHVMDLYPDAIVASGMLSERSPLVRAVARVTRKTVATADATIALGRDMRQRIIDRYTPPHPDRIHVVTPWADGDDLRPIDKVDNPLANELGLADTFNVVYSGNLGVAHDVYTIAAAIDATRDSRQLRWVFIGGGKRFDELREVSVEKRWPHLRLLPFQDRDKLNLSLNLADVHLVSQLPAFTGVVVPSKLFGILAVGKPTIMVGPGDAECSMILREARAGLVVPNGDAAGVVQAVRTLHDDVKLRRETGARARACFEARYDRRVCCGQIERLLSDVVATTSRA
ncbi:MAG TPA: glycosyltransferase family 4 protein [Tepidisphaeraceae bacterium]|nr:glycosyltransferase family 4 protein [Tepidisphaeraceae bacterium]